MNREDPVTGAILGRIGDRNACFVFPSQAAADAWAREICRRPEIGAMETDRFMGWDRLADRMTRHSIPAAGAPADDARRMLWAAGTASDAAGRDVSPAYIAFRARIAPSLRTLARSAGNATASAREYSSLSASYDDFLARHALYERAHLEPRAPQGTEKFLVFGAELIADFPRYRDASGGAVSAFTPTEAETRDAIADTELERFPNLRAQLRRVFARCRTLLEQGIAPSRIAISLPPGSASQAEAEAQLSRSAAEAGIALSFRWARPLAASPFGRLLGALANAAEEGCSLESLRILMRFDALRWRSRRDPANLPEALLTFGEKYRVLRQTGHWRRSDIWETSFSACPHDPATARFYRRVRASIRAISESASFDALRSAIHTFRDEFLDEAQTDPATVRTTERIMEELETLAAALVKTPGESYGMPPLKVLLARISQVRYLDTPEPGTIPVYPYPLAALSPARAHFILESSHTGLSLPETRFDFIDEELRERLGEERGVSERTALACALPGHAVFCHADEGFGGWSVPHPWFDSAGISVRRISGEESPAPMKDSRTARTAPTAPTAHTAHTARPAGSPLSAQAITEAIRLSSASKDAPDRLRFSPSSLGTARNCPFLWFAERTPGSFRDGSADEAFPARVAGEFAHDAIRCLYARIAALGPWNPESAETCKAFIPDAIAEASIALVRRRGPFAAIVGESWAPLLSDRLARMIDNENTFAGWNAGQFEQVLRSDGDPDLAADFEGRADRIAWRENPDGAKIHAIIDYKKKDPPRRKDIFLDAEGGLADLQMAAYVELCERSGMKVERALFWSIERAGALGVFGPYDERPDAEAYRGERRALLRALAEAADMVRAGTFLRPDPQRGPCAGCAWKAACRANFASERGA